MSLPRTYVEGFHDEASCRRMKYAPFGNTGLEVSILGFGASSLGSTLHATAEDESIRVVHTAIRKGINLIDVAPWYGHGKAETVLGKALKDVPRESYYISTKVGRYQPEVEAMFDFSAERTLQSVEESLQRLGLDYVDIIQVHDMEFATDLDVIMNETLPALEKVKAAGKAKFIGITGYPVDNFRQILENCTVHVDSILSYCHGAMYDNSLAELIPYLKSQGVGVINASPIGMGLLCERGPPKWHPASTEIREACSLATAYCKERGICISKLAVHFTLHQNCYTTTLIGTASVVELEENIIAVHSDLTEIEKQTQSEVIKKFFLPLKNHNWEGIEVTKYRKKLAARLKEVNLCID